MTRKASFQTLDRACEVFVEWLDGRILAEGRGNELNRLEVDPAGTFWLGRLASEEEILNSSMGDRAERLDPCAIGIRVRPKDAGPWTFTVRARARAWVKDAREVVKNPQGPWARSAPVEVELLVTVSATDLLVTTGRDNFASALSAVGADGLGAEIRVDVEHWQGELELVIQLVNTSPEKHGLLKDTHLYETELEVAGLASRPFELEALPDSFRYNRKVPAHGINVGIDVIATTPPTFRTTDTVAVTTARPTYWNSPAKQPDLTFATLSQDPIPQLRALVEALAEWNEQNWSDDSLTQRAGEQNWSHSMKAEAQTARSEVANELSRLEKGLGLIEADSTIRRAFQLMNRAIAYSSADREYASWRPFQIGFLLGAVAFLVNPKAEAGIVDTVWFATGGGKTETYLGLLVTAAIHDRLTGKTTGVTAWSRFPLRLLSLQQTQRFADALAGAERVRREEGIKGAPISLGFLVGKGGTPNRIVTDTNGDNPDPESPGMPDKYQVLLRCPFCHADSIVMRFDRRYWRLGHQCSNASCPWPERYLPFYVVDEEIYRFLPTVVLGTLDKAASISIQAAMRGLVGPPLGLCTEDGHGYTYAPRGQRPNGCLVPNCPGKHRSLPMSRDRFAPSLRLQDELHLLRDSLGAVDSHYESLLDHLQESLGAPPAKIVASSATLAGHDRQVEVLYRRKGRVFPLQGPSIEQSFWTRRTQTPLRRFVAIAPRGVTLEHVSDRTINVLQKSVRRLLSDPVEVCAEANIDPAYATDLLSIYGTDVLYGTSLYDVEAAQRSLASNTDVPINSEQLTGQTEFDDVRDILDRLEQPESDFADRIHAIAASSMLSHGVDVARLNVMVMLGLPLSTAEFIQTSSRVGRRWPGLVHVLHKIGRERDAQTFRHFEHYVTHGDRFVEPIPITRRSRRVLRLTLPGIVEARRLALMEPASANQRLTMVKTLRDYVQSNAVTPANQTETIVRALGFTGPADELLREEIRIWLQTWFANLEDPASGIKWPNELGPDAPMFSLRDVEARAPIRD